MSVNKYDKVNNRLIKIAGNGGGSGSGGDLIAEEFDSTKAYGIGDWVTHEGSLYVFTSAHTANDPWDATEVSETTVAEEFENVVTSSTIRLIQVVTTLPLDAASHPEILYLVKE